MTRKYDKENLDIRLQQKNNKLRDEFYKKNIYAEK